MKNNPLLDKDFLLRLDKHHEKEVWAKIIALDINENPKEEITGQIMQGGSINIDGTSAVRRSCSLSLIAKDININNFYWGLNTKFKLLIGLTNNIDSKYSDIIWFPQGVYIITSFNTSQGINNYTISIQGKDKMCLLNGEIGGTLTAPIDFGKIEERDEEGNITIKDIPIKDIIKESIHEYAKEPWHNIIVNDLDKFGIELLEYKGSKPLYLLIDEKTNEVTNMTMNENFLLYNNNSQVSIKDIDNLNLLNKLNEFYPGMESEYFIGYLKEKPEENDHLFSIAKIECGQTAGYRLTDIVYAGDLIASQGDSLTSILDKIVQMLGQFEYFYDLDGRFVFQEKKTYVQTSWNNLITTSEEEVIADIMATPYGYEFKGSDLTISFSNNPNLDNLRNDFSIWGTRKSLSGVEIPIHLRYAIDKKPFSYTSFSINQEEANEYNKIFKPKEDLIPRDSITYTSDEWDWRELIYQMAKDYRKFNHWDKFLIKVRDSNIINGEFLYPTGYTGYEQYYIDLEGFWRQLYNPNYMVDDKKIILGGDGLIETEIELNGFGKFNNISIDDIYLYPLKPIGIDKENYIPEDSFVITELEDRCNVESFLNTIALNERDIYYIKYNKDEEPKEITFKTAKSANKSSLLIKEENEYFRLVDKEFEKANNLYYQSKTPEKLINLKGNKLYYKTEDTFWPYYFTKEKVEDINNVYYYSQNKINYYYSTFNYYGEENEDKMYWNKNVWNAPELLNFWFDFLDTSSEMNKYSISAIGNRPKVINDSNIKSIYFRETPNVIFINKNNVIGWEFTERKSGYTYIQLPDSMLSLFNLSSQGKSAWNVLEETIYNNACCIESAMIVTIPIYYLKPNTRVYIRDDNSKINGEYIMSRFTIPLSYNGTMSISATKVTDKIY